jgi:DNA invertase Pin-like site-specific DNA recombinase
MGNKALAYIRVSTTKQELSPELQLDRIQKYCVLNNLDLVEVITESVSAKIALSKRPEGSKIRAMVKTNISHIVSLKLDRLFRNAGDALVTTEEWNKVGIELHLVDQPIFNTGGSMGRFVLTMFAGFAELERSMISERTIAALDHKRSKGEYTGGNVPYGSIVRDGRLAPDSIEQAVLDRLRIMRTQGMGYARCATELNAEGIKSKTGKQWHPFAVQCVLKNNTSSS